MRSNRTWGATRSGARRQRTGNVAVAVMLAVVLALAVLARHPVTGARAHTLIDHARTAGVLALVCAGLILAGRSWLRRQRALRLQELTAWREACRQAERGGYEPPARPRTKLQQVAVSPWGRTWFAVLPLAAARLSWEHLPAGLARLLLIAALIVAPGIWFFMVDQRRRWAATSIAVAYLLLWLPVTDRGAAALMLLLGLAAAEARRRWFNREPAPEPEPEPEPVIEIPLTPAAIWDDKFGAPGKPLAGSLLLDVQPIIRKPSEEDWS